MSAVWAASLLTMAGWWMILAAAHSPCSDLLQNVQLDRGQGRWDAIISLPALNTIYPIWLNVVFDGKADIVGTWAKGINSTDNQKIIIKQTKMRPYTKSEKNIQYYVNPEVKIPKVIAIKLNGTEICNVEAMQLASDRLMTISENTIRKKRELSWTQYIGTRETKPVPSKPEHNEQLSNWMCYISGYQALPSCGQVDFRVDTEPEHVDKPGVNWTSYITELKPAPPSPSITPAPKPNLFDDQPGLNWTSYITGLKPAPPGPPMIPAPKPNQIDEKEVCGQANPKPALYKGNATHAGQWPWQIALYHNEHIDNKFKCGGTLVSWQHVVTAAHCVTLERSLQLVKKDTISVYLGRHNLRNSTHGVQIRFVLDVVVHPQYNATSFARDLSILKLTEPVQYTDYVRPICLWPEDKVELSNIVGKKGTVVGWGLDQNGVETEELGQIEIPVVAQDTCLRSNTNFYETVISNTTYCAGLGIGSTACQGDSGGGMVMNMGGTWYLRGLVSISLQHVINGCDPSNYLVFTDLAKFLPWIKENVASTN